MRSTARRAGLLAAGTVVVVALSCASPHTRPQQTFATPEAAVLALIEIVKAGNKDELLRVFGPEGEELAASSDPATARHNREVFTVAIAEDWRLVEHGADRRILTIGHEKWPFPLPLVREPNGWRFDTAAGVEEVLARRIGRNELAVIQICRTYVVAQHLYARHGHDGKPKGLYARTFRSDPGKQNGLYWPVKRGEKRSPLGDLVADAAAEGRNPPAAGGKPSPFHGYYFKILTSQGDSAHGGAKDYVVQGEMSGGFGLLAWPAEYDVTGVMTFIVNQDGVVHEKDLGPETDARVTAITRFDPDPTWTIVR